MGPVSAGAAIGIALGALALLVMAGIAVDIWAWLQRAAAIATLAPAPANPPIAGSCGFSVGPNPPTAATPGLLLGGALAGGSHAAGSIALPAGQAANATGSVELVAFGDIDIEGLLRGDPGAGLVLVSLTGNIRVGAQGAVGGSIGVFGADDTAGFARPAVAGAGEAGQPIRLIALKGNIDILGKVGGHDGGDGGAATDRGFGRLPLPTGAAGGCGGPAGEVWLCALESIHLGAAANIVGGTGGDGGGANAASTLVGPALSLGGVGGPGGKVRLGGLAAGAHAQVFLDAGSLIRGGAGGTADVSQAQGGDGVVVAGADGDASAGAGGAGAGVEFSGCLVMTPPPFAVDPGPGGDGGFATAVGGEGGESVFGAGEAGGGATAHGGDGGPPGPAVSVPVPGGAAAGGSAVTRPDHTSTSGSASVQPGDGGATVNPFRKGGSSGAGLAQAGVGGVTGATPPAAPVAPVAATGTAGAKGGPGVSAGLP